MRDQPFRNRRNGHRTASRHSGSRSAGYISAVDERVFQIDPRSADIPSLKNDEEVNDASITQRAIGRKRNGFGKGLGDVVLPSGRTVSQLVGNAVATAY